MVSGIHSAAALCPQGLLAPACGSLHSNSITSCQLQDMTAICLSLHSGELAHSLIDSEVVLFEANNVITNQRVLPLQQGCRGDLPCTEIKHANNAQGCSLMLVPLL